MEKYTMLNGKEVKAYGDYYRAKKQAEKNGLKLAEYGDVYGMDLSYAYWNASGNRNDDEEVIVYYRFENGKPKAISKEELHRYLFN